MRFIDDWLRQRTIYGLMSLYGTSLVLVITLLLLAPTIVSPVAVLPILLIWRCRKESERRDDLVKSWADREMFIAFKSKGT